jgi:hypothetical protein
MGSVEIYGIVGRKQHGKDTFARMVKERSRTFKVLHFADVLKEQASKIFGLPLRVFHDNESKDKPFAEPLYMDAFLPFMCQVSGLRIRARGWTANTPRELLQRYGTQYVRSIEPSYWTQSLVDTIGSPTGQRVLVADVRFDEEVRALRLLGGKLIKIVRIDLPIPENEHESERNVDTISVDLTLGARTGDLRLLEWVAALVATNKLGCALRYDYRCVMAALGAHANGRPLKDCYPVLGPPGASAELFRRLQDYYQDSPP